ncbi:hypothetical protein [Marinoscillum luteum]|uniref:Lipocalin-like domain-containing protein n=1 Tax=Marinoscillum luteum TaxID=861051 RepID=A0ABW7N889_9BACT
MKKLSLTIFALLLIAFTYQAEAQSKVVAKDLIGSWKLVIDVDEEFEEAKREVDEEDSFLGKIILNSVSGIVSGILEEIDIYMEFKPGGEVKVIVEAFDEREIEYSEWQIDKKGRLYISDTENFSTGDSDYWLMEKGVLILFEDDNERSDNVYLVNMDSN